MHTVSRHSHIYSSYLNDHNGTDPNSAIGNTGSLGAPILLYLILISVDWLTGGAILVEKIKDTRDALAALNIGKTIPVGNSDAGYYFNTRVLEASDFGVNFPRLTIWTFLTLRSVVQCSCLVRQHKYCRFCTMGLQILWGNECCSCIAASQQSTLLSRHFRISI